MNPCPCPLQFHDLVGMGGMLLSAGSLEDLELKLEAVRLGENS